MRPHPDHLGLVADMAINKLAIYAKEIEQIAFSLGNTTEAHELSRIAEGMRDQEVLLRARISALARANRG